MTAPSAVQPGASRRVVLIDFDWQDADLLPVLCKRPELSIRLVAGSADDDPGLRVAELCGLHVPVKGGREIPGHAGAGEVPFVPTWVPPLRW